MKVEIKTVASGISPKQPSRPDRGKEEREQEEDVGEGEGHLSKEVQVRSKR